MTDNSDMTKNLQKLCPTVDYIDICVAIEQFRVDEMEMEITVSYSGISIMVEKPPAAAAFVAVSNPSHSVRPGSLT